MAYKRPESVLVLIYDQHQQVLVLQRQDDANFWQSVTGTMEPGETPFETALREVKEETGIDIQALGLDLIDCQQTHTYQIRPQWQHRYAPGTKTNTEHTFRLALPFQPEIQLTEHLSYLWLPASQAMAKVWSQTNAEAIRHWLPDNKQEQ